MTQRQDIKKVRTRSRAKQVRPGEDRIARRYATGGARGCLMLACKPEVK